MKEPDIIAFLRIKNEERWIRSCLSSISQICRGIVILDDGSTDDTIKICEQFPKVLEIHKQSGLPFNEIRDRRRLLKMALKHDPEFIMSVDGDEIIQPNARDILFEELNILYPNYNVLAFQEVLMWDKPNQYRCDGVFSSTWWTLLLRLSGQPQNLRYFDPMSSKVAHGSRLPDNAVGLDYPIRSKVKILHYGYFDSSLRLRNYQFYTNLDDNKKNFDDYKHSISGEGKFSGKNGIKIKLLPKSLLANNSRHIDNVSRN